MIQNIIALVIVALVLLKTIHAVYKAITTREKGVCGGCASCDLKSELKKKGKLGLHAGTREGGKIQYSADNLKYSLKE
jgi:hypothetical protein